MERLLVKNIKELANSTWAVSIVTGLLVYFFTAGLKPIGFAAVLSSLSGSYSKAVASAFTEIVAAGFSNHNSWVVWTYVAVLTRISIEAAVDFSNPKSIRLIAYVMTASMFLFAFYYNSVNSAALSLYREYRSSVINYSLLSEREAGKRALNVATLGDIKKLTETIQQLGKKGSLSN
ncbi:hypothetical protein V3W47_01995 [Deinococcus sp. YIM 134068]|uniref:hypothetical protein n=1 Tax=Deinococcus lichenicola TaxID=3118910 RepID=UPI002F92A8BF